jgi:hypothetical protein
MIHIHKAKEWPKLWIHSDTFTSKCYNTLMQPGTTINPGDQDQTQLPKPEEVASLPEPAVTAQPNDVPTPEPEPDEQPDSPREPNEPDAPESTWQYQPEADSGALPPARPPIAGVSWTASEYIEHEKRAGWFIALSLATVAAGALMYLITRDIVSVVVAVVVAALFGTTGARKPRTLNYQLDSSGVSIESKHYPYESFKSFSVLDEGAFSSVTLLPLRRFMPTLSLYYPPEQEDSILQTLANYLPHEERSHDPIERLMRRVRF